MFETPRSLTADHLTRIWQHTGLNEPLATWRLLPGGFSKLIYDLNDRYILRVTFRTSGEEGEAREQAALLRLAHIPGTPKVVGLGTLDADGPLPYIVVTKLPGEPVFRAWLASNPATQGGRVHGMVDIIRQVHAIPVDHYTIGYHQTALRDWHGGWRDGHDAYFRSLLHQVRQIFTEPDILHLFFDATERYYNAHHTALDYMVGPRLLHGDLQLYNVIADGDRVSGIIDWEWAHGGEPDFDMADLIRWTFYPEDPAEEELESAVDATTYALLPSTLLAAYPEVASVPRLAERLTIYLMEYDLHHLSQWSHSPDKPRRRLAGWLQSKLGEYLSER